MDPNESKRDKRRRDMVERVERLRRDTIDRKDAIYADLHGSFSVSLAAMLAQPHATHPEYLLRLHAQSIQRDNDILAARLEATYASETASQLYHTEVERVQDEYEAAKKAIKEKLLEACDERAKRLKEDKDSLEVPGLGDMLDSAHSKHATRRRGNLTSASAGNPAGPSGTAAGSLNGAQGVGISGISLPLPASSALVGTDSQAGSSSAMGATSSSAGLLASTSGGHPNLSSAHITDPFTYSLLPASPALSNNALHPSMLLLQPNSVALLQSLKHGAHSYRTTGGRTKAGYPPNGLVIPPGTYAVFGKSLAALNSLRAEEIADDMEGIRFMGKKRKRGGDGRAKRHAVPDAF